MRHALIRLLALLEIDAHWFVMKPKPEIFDITKGKFHNVLHAVAKPDVHLTDQDKALFEQWSRDNFEKGWKEVIPHLDVIAIDDPQPSGLIPFIKELNPRCKIIFRSHIQVRADLVDKPETEQHHVWSYLWNYIQHADLFISHPVAGFVPSCVPKEKLLLMPATTDRLDGLNKELDDDSKRYYRSVFNRLLHDAVGKKVDWGRRYIVQIARFDPSKGYPDVIKSYAKLRSRLSALNPPLPREKIPQLILAGHGSIDDPDGNMVYEQVLSMLKEDAYSDISDDVFAARLPPSDQLLNILMDGATVCTQLSIREGFEIKVTEALNQGIPVVAYAAGGIPHQIQNGLSGYLVKTGDVEAVAEKLFKLCTDENLRERMGRDAQRSVPEEYFTVFQTINWLYLFRNLTLDPPISFPPPGFTPLEKPAPAISTLYHEQDERYDSTPLEDGRTPKDIREEFEEMKRELGGRGNIWVKDLWRWEYNI